MRSLVFLAWFCPRYPRPAQAFLIRRPACRPCLGHSHPIVRYEYLEYLGLHARKELCVLCFQMPSDMIAVECSEIVQRLWQLATCVLCLQVCRKSCQNVRSERSKPILTLVRLRMIQEFSTFMLRKPKGLLKIHTSVSQAHTKKAIFAVFTAYQNPVKLPLPASGPSSDGGATQVHVWCGSNVSSPSATKGNHGTRLGLIKVTPPTSPYRSRICTPISLQM